jgi:hypothetical protein
MIAAKKCVNVVIRKIDRINTDRNRDLEKVDICNAITEAERRLFKDRLEHFEENSIYRSQLALFEIQVELLPVKVTDEHTLFEVPKDFAMKTGGQILATRSGCPDQIIDLTTFERDDIKGGGLKDPYWRANFEWEQCFWDEGGGFFWVFNQYGVSEMNAPKLILDYVRWPVPVHAPSMVEPQKSYEDYDGEIITKDQGWEMDFIFEEGMDLAALILTTDIGDRSTVQERLGAIIQGNNVQKL